MNFYKESKSRDFFGGGGSWGGGGLEYDGRGQGRPKRDKTRKCVYETLCPQPYACPEKRFKSERTGCPQFE